MLEAKHEGVLSDAQSLRCLLTALGLGLDTGCTQSGAQPRFNEHAETPGM